MLSTDRRLRDVRNCPNSGAHSGAHKVTASCCFLFPLNNYFLKKKKQISKLMSLIDWPCLVKNKRKKKKHTLQLVVNSHSVLYPPPPTVPRRSADNLFPTELDSRQAPALLMAVSITPSSSFTASSISIQPNLGLLLY